MKNKSKLEPLNMVPFVEIDEGKRVSIEARCLLKVDF